MKVGTNVENFQSWGKKMQKTLMDFFDQVGIYLKFDM